MNRRIKQVWLLAILSSFLLIGLQTYWLYNSVTYSMGEMGKKNAEKAEQAIVTYQTNIGAAVREKSHIGYVVTAYFQTASVPVQRFALHWIRIQSLVVWCIASRDSAT